MGKIMETTSDALTTAENICSQILAAKLSPCVQIIKDVQSSYLWDNEIVTENEYVIKIKTLEKYMAEITSIIENLSTYDVPEVISYNFTMENPEYRNWFYENIG